MILLDKKLYYIFGILLIVCVLCFQACDETQTNNKQVLSDMNRNIPASALEKLSKNKIYFGHQSVGFNIIDGVTDIINGTPDIKLNIVKTHDPEAFEKPVFAHSAVGQNMNPKSKIDDFTGFMDRGIGNKADFSFFKFCYVDFTEHTDVQKTFLEYKNAMAYLSEKYPETIFIHVTVPLTSNRADIKTIVKNVIKKIIGRPVRSYKDNVRRNQFNDLLRKEYEGREPLFDLAMIESTLPDGKKVINSENGITFYSLAPEYTDDGGHLNEKGRRIAARQLLLFLAGLPARNHK